MKCYRQCELMNGKARTVSWIDVNVAQEGWRLRLEDRDGFWTVVNVYDKILDHTQLTDLRKTQKEFESKVK